jgi:dimethylaniline monooxygenase (N-oxide forming)
MPDSYPLFPHHTQIMAFLRSYVEHFQLRPHIRLNHLVKKLVKEDGTWLLTASHSDGQDTGQDSGQDAGQNALAFDAVILCTGQAHSPAYPTEAMYAQFSGPTMHSHEYKHPLPEMHGRNILVVGGGESAADIANEVSSVANKLYLSLRRGRWFLDRHTGARLPLDTRFSRRGRFLIGDYGGNFLGMAIFDAMTGLTLGRGGHGIEEWQPAESVLRSFVNKSREVLHRVITGQVIPRRRVRAIDSRRVWFDGCEEPADIDMIIYATGFQQKYPFLPEANPKQAYKYVFDPADPTLAYAGTARPVFGSIPALAELQARWISAVFAGRCQLPSSEAMQKEIEKDHRRHSKLFPVDHARLPNLVSHFEYADFIMKQLGIKPNLLKVFFTDNKRWRVLVSVPWTAFEALLTDPEQGQGAYNRIYKVYAAKKSIKRRSLFKFMLVLFALALISIAGLLVLITVVLF